MLTQRERDTLLDDPNRFKEARRPRVLVGICKDGRRRVQPYESLSFGEGRGDPQSKSSASSGRIALDKDDPVPYGGWCKQIPRANKLSLRKETRKRG